MVKYIMKLKFSPRGSSHWIIVFLLRGNKSFYYLLYVPIFWWNGPMVDFFTFFCVFLEAIVFEQKLILNFKQRTLYLMLTVHWPHCYFALINSFTIIIRLSDMILSEVHILNVVVFLILWRKLQVFWFFFCGSALVASNGVELLCTRYKLSFSLNHTYCHMITWNYTILRFFWKFFHGLILFGIAYRSMQQA